MLSRIRTVLIHNSHPGNIGASARALKNMGLSQLILVAPKEFPSKEAEARASNAQDILAKVKVYSTVEEALLGCSWVVGCSARQRKLSLPTFSPKEAASKIHQQFLSGNVVGEVAILYGNEKQGLSNEELALCSAQIIIPTVSEYSSLNLAQAVQIISYELFLTQFAVPKSENVLSEITDREIREDNTLPSFETLAEFYRELEKTLIDIEFLDPKKPGQMVPRLKRLFARAAIDKTELTLLRGMLTSMQKSMKNLNNK